VKQEPIHQQLALHLVRLANLAATWPRQASLSAQTVQWEHTARQIQLELQPAHYAPLAIYPMSLGVHLVRLANLAATLPRQASLSAKTAQLEHTDTLQHHPTASQLGLGRQASQACIHAHLEL